MIDYSNSKYLIKRLAKEYIYPYKKSFLTAIILMIIIAITTALLAWLVKPALDKVFFQKDQSMLILIPLVILAVTIVKGVATYFQLLIMNLLTVSIGNDMRKKLYAHFINSDLSLLNNFSSGEMIGKMFGEINSIISAINIVINSFIKQFLTLIFLIAVMINQSLVLSLISFIGMPLAIYPIYKISKKLRKLSFANQEMIQKFVSQMDDTLQYSKLVKSYNCEAFEISRMSSLIKKMLKVTKKIVRISLISSPFVEMLGGIGIAAVIYYGGVQVFTGQTSTGAFFSFFTAMLMAYKPLKSVSGMNSGIQSGLGAAERLYKLVDQKPKIVDKDDAIELKDAKNELLLENIHFSYDEKKNALSGVTMNIKVGTKVALVGNSGGGKSTIMSMILRFYDPKKGNISIDGNNIKDVNIKSLRNLISVVSQEVMLFDDTILENIRYGRENATKEEIIKVAKLAEAHSFINELPDKYDTKIGQNGLKLSGGQRQRISIARAILYNSPILFLDEATSSLDPISENLIKIALEKLMENRTTLIIAHRLSTIVNCDQIFVITDGKVEESGKHAELLKKGGKYSDLYSKQFVLDKE